MKFLLSTCLFLSLAAIAHANEAQPSEQVIKEAEESVKKLTRPVHVYNWSKRSWIKSPEGEGVMPNDPRIGAHLASTALRFSDPKVPLNQQGPNGIYSATGPFVTREYGTSGAKFDAKDWLLSRITLPAGTRFFDGRMNKKFGPALLEYLDSHGCDANTMSQLMQVKWNATAPQCWKAYVKLVPAMNIQAIVKNFFSMGPAFCPTHNNHGIDFIIVDPKVTTDYAGYVAEIPLDDIKNEERFFIRDFWLLARKNANAICSATQPAPWDNLGTRFSGNRCTFVVSSPMLFSIPWDKKLPASVLEDPQFKMTEEFAAPYREKISGCANFREDLP